MTSTNIFLIWSNEHRAWWGPNERGYFQSRSEAGRYPMSKAIEICLHANMARRDNEFPHEAMVPIDPDEFLKEKGWEGTKE